MDTTLVPRTTDVCVVESGGHTAAVLDRDIVGLLPLVVGTTPRPAGLDGVRTMVMDGRPRPLVSLRAALCLPKGRAEEVVVVLRLGDQLFGLTVERVRAVEQAVVLPTLDPPYPLAMFAHLVQADPIGALSILNPARLALCAGQAETRYLAAA
jgi:chemotaxis protein histidine kinase CheA